MKKAVKKTAKKRPVTSEFRPYRVLFLIVLISVTCLVMFALLGVTSEM
jgi:hypothetical protein